MILSPRLRGAGFLVLALGSAPAVPAQVTRYVRYTAEGRTGYGVLEADRIRELSGDLFGNPRPTGRSVPLAGASLLAPIVPGKVIAVGLNYKSHLGERPTAQYPGLFAKMPTSIVGPGADIIYPPDAGNLHYEGELVVVIGKRASKVSAADAPQYVFGVTAGNDVSERDWQRSDLQWFRAKATDTFGPLGPAIVTGLNYGDLLLQTRLNGEVVQSQRTRDLIFTGTPGTTRPMKPGDVVEVEIEGVGVLRNRVRAP